MSTKVDTIVDQISSLTLLETADLVSSLKSRLNIQEIAMSPAAAAPAAAAPAEEAVAGPVVEEKSVFAVKLESFEAGSKAKVIKEVKALLGLNLVEAKKFVEAAPKVLKEGVTKEDAEKIQKMLQDLGCKVVLE